MTSRFGKREAYRRDGNWTSADEEFFHEGDRVEYVDIQGRLCPGVILYLQPGTCKLMGSALMARYAVQLEDKRFLPSVEGNELKLVSKAEPSAITHWNPRLR